MYGDGGICVNGFLFALFSGFLGSLFAAAEYSGL